MGYQLRILDAIAGADPAGLLAEAGRAITAGGSWERFVEVRMSAGPIVRITGDGRSGYEVSVGWGSQEGRLRARALQSAIECADRLAHVFYEMRGAGMIRD